MVGSFSIVTAFDSNFVELAGVFLHSLSKQEKTVEQLSKIYALVYDVSPDDQAILKALSPRPIEFLDVSGLLDNDLGTVFTNRITIVAYARLFLPNIVSGDERLIYIDADTIVLGEIVDLATIDLEGRPVGAVETRSSWSRRKVAELGLPAGTRYLNSGVLVIDLAAWRACKVSENAISAAVAQGDRPWNHDQDALLLALDDNWKTIDRRWNMRPSDYRFLTRQANDARIAHFIGIKPNNLACEHPDRALYLALRAETPFAAWPVNAGPPMTLGKRWRRLLRLVRRALREGIYRLYGNRLFGEIARM